MLVNHVGELEAEEPITVSSSRLQKGPIFLWPRVENC